VLLLIDRQSISILAASAVLASLTVASPALADDSGTFPAGCSASPCIPAVSGGEVTFGGEAYCPGAGSADFRLVHDYDNLPDVRVTDVNISNIANGPMSYFSSTCDNGPATTKYYSEIHIYVSGAPQRVSKTVTSSHC
jgi:hypothetical protein